MHLAVVSMLYVFAASLVAAPPDQPWFPKAPALPPPSGPVLEVATVEELFQAVENVPPGGTILLADGRYMLPSVLTVAADDVTLRSRSGNRHAVVVDGENSRHGELV
ncbi:MAG: hypothetical protein KY475_16375, partial [Planctomycetes bacterium]|nr:hypothetical protein [Planctomycetota bacterium]